MELLAAIGRVAATAIHNAQLFEREKTLLREREEFVSLVAHELKNPLAAIMGYHQIATRRLRPHDDGLRRPLRVIAEQTERLNRLVEDLLDLSRVDAGRLSLERKPVGLALLIRETVDQQQVQTAFHRLEVKIIPPLPPIVADKMRIGQVLQNLLANAIKYSPNDGMIEIRASEWLADDGRWPAHVCHLASRHERWAVVEVQDHGLGIAPIDLPKVFGRFFRAEKTIEEQIPGAGLGLSICAELIHVHGGLIWVESTLGEGSTFAFALPAQETGEGG